MNVDSSLARGVVGLVFVGSLFAFGLWPKPASAFHIKGIAINVVSVDSVAGSVNINVTESSGTPFGSFVAPNIAWGDANSAAPAWTSNFTDTGSPGLNFHKVSASHVYPDLSSRTITVTSDCCGSPSPAPLVDTVQIDFGCADTPMGGCRTAMKAQLQIKNNSDDTKDQLKFKWLKGQETLIDALDDPMTSTEYYVCIYAPGKVFEAVVPPGGLWAAAGTTGFKYQDPSGTPGGITKIKVKSGADGKAKVLVGGKGVNLQDPLPLTQPVTVQVQNSEGECWGHQFTNPEKENSADKFQDKEP